MELSFRLIQIGDVLLFFFSRLCIRLCLFYIQNINSMDRITQFTNAFFPCLIQLFKIIALLYGNVSHFFKFIRILISTILWNLNYPIICFVCCFETEWIIEFYFLDTFFFWNVPSEKMLWSVFSVNIQALCRRAIWKYAIIKWMRSIQLHEFEVKFFFAVISWIVVNEYFIWLNSKIYRIKYMPRKDHFFVLFIYCCFQIIIWS